MNAERAQAVRRLVESWLVQRAQPGTTTEVPADVEVLRADLIRPGRPALLDVVARVDGRLAHVVIGLRSVGDETHFIRPGDEGGLGLLDDEGGLSVCVDALRDAELAALLLATVRGVEHRRGPVASVRDDDEATILNLGDRGDLVVFPWLSDTPRPEVDMLVALDAAGFNHVAAPLVRWTWEGRDLGVIQEPLADRSGGWALALASLRDFYASDSPPEEAGADFGSEAHALGMMAARMHLALDRAFPRRPEKVAAWVDETEAAVRAAEPTLLETPGVADLFEALRSADMGLPVIRTHGDLHLGRTSRTDQGWVVSDCLPGGVLPGQHEPTERSPLADVADLLWSMHQATLTAAQERDPAGRLDLADQGQAWENRNRRALVSGYLSTPGITGLTSPDRDLIRNLLALFELTRSIRST